MAFQPCYQQPKLSVLISIFNETSSYIYESVKSILNQTFTNFELIIIVDNPERKEIEKIIKSFDDDRIVLCYNDQNIGLALSMNRAASIARADILARMDADDIAYPERLKKEYELIKSGNYDFIFTGYDLIDEQSNIVKAYIPQEDYSHEQLSKMIHLKHIIHHPTVMFTKKIFNKVGGYRDFPCTQDLDLWFRMVENGCRFHLINAPLLKYRINNNGVSSQKWFLQKLTGNYIFHLSIERLKNGYDSYSWDNYQRFLLDKGINSEYMHKRLRKSQSFLFKSSSTSNILLSLFYKLCAFLCSKISRDHYMMLIKKSKLINQ